MKASVERLGPTRVKLNVEVPFGELEPHIHAAYQRFARSVKVQGFRPGKVPPRLIDQRVGRAAVLEEAVNDALPRLYAQAVTDNKVEVVGRPEVDLTSFGDGEQLTFTAEVDVRPDIDLPAYDALPVTVDDADPPPDEVDRQLANLQDRFAVLSGVERAVEPGDYVSIDLRATIDGEEIEGSTATGLSYEVGGTEIVPGINEALLGASAGDTRTFETELQYGERAGQTAKVEVTVNSVKVKQVPPLDDDFAQTASEFDTLAELRADVEARLARVGRLQQGIQARDRALEALVGRVEVALPAAMVDAEYAWRRERLDAQLAQAGASYEEWLSATEQDAASVEAEMRTGAEQAVKAQLVLDAIAAREEVDVTDAELSTQVVRRAQRQGVPPEDYARQLAEHGQLGSVIEDLRRGKALAQVLESAVVTDASGRRVDLEALRADVTGPDAASA
ncbi:MAG: trigger factor [Mycobacteriales bacterium]|nr:trigger factor [Frankia sp.]